MQNKWHIFHTRKRTLFFVHLYTQKGLLMLRKRCLVSGGARKIYWTSTHRNFRPKHGLIMAGRLGGTLRNILRQAQINTEEFLKHRWSYFSALRIHESPLLQIQIRIEYSGRIFCVNMDKHPLLLVYWWTAMFYIQLKFKISNYVHRYNWDNRNGKVKIRR